jgi:uncharacterized protein
MQNEDTIIQAYRDFLGKKSFPCIAAKASLARDQVQCMVAAHMGCPADDERILSFIYGFVEHYRESKKLYHSAAVIFRGPSIDNEHAFDALLWQRLSALALLDKNNYTHDKRVDSDPTSKKFSFSLKEEAFFIIALHPASSRRSRQFYYPTLVFNPHQDFEKLRRKNRYEQMKKIVRKRDLTFSGSINPMLKDYGEASEVYQYSGIKYNADWKCPLQKDHEEHQDNSAT